MSNVSSWHLLPPDLMELQIGQIDLLTAMYPDEVAFGDEAKELLEKIRKESTGDCDFSEMPAMSIALNLPIIDEYNKADVQLSPQTLRLNLVIPFSTETDELPLEAPDVKVQIQQPTWLNRAATTLLMDGIPPGEDFLGMIEHIKEAAMQHLQQASKEASSQRQKTGAPSGAGPLVRVWFYFPSISTRSKRDDFIKYAPSYDLTGFLYAGKPGLLCVEGECQSIDDYMKLIKTESWGDIPSHHKKVSERHREKCEARKFPVMTEITDLVGERRGQRANRGDMKAVEEWLVERGLGDAFTKVFM